MSKLYLSTHERPDDGEEIGIHWPLPTLAKPVYVELIIAEADAIPTAKERMRGTVEESSLSRLGRVYRRLELLDDGDAGSDLFYIFILS